MSEGPPFESFEEAVRFLEAQDQSVLCFPGREPGLASFECPDCGNEIDAPFGGRVWTCHEEYGGCGASFRPEKVFRRVEE